MSSCSQLAGRVAPSFTAMIVSKHHGLVEDGFLASARRESVKIVVEPEKHRRDADSRELVVGDMTLGLLEPFTPLQSRLCESWDTIDLNVMSDDPNVLFILGLFLFIDVDVNSFRSHLVSSSLIVLGRSNQATPLSEISCSPTGGSIALTRVGTGENGGAMTTEEQFEKTYPHIAWREPLPTQCMDGSEGLACRFCVALRGLKGTEIGGLPKTREAFDRHMAEAHPKRERGKQS